VHNDDVHVDALHLGYTGAIPHVSFHRSALLVGTLTCVWLVGCTQAPSEPGGRATPQAEPTVEVLFTYGSEKQNWIEETTKAFNDARRRTAGGKVIHVEAIPMGSGEVVDEILTDKRHPHLISPASGAFIKLGNAESRAKTGSDLVSATQNLVLSPVVIAMWQPMAEALGWGKRAIGWADVAGLARKSEGWAAYGHPEWGRFKFGHTHPRASNSGLISLLAEAYAGAGKIGGLTMDDVRRPETAKFIEGVEQAVVHYGSSTGFFGRKMFTSGPGYLSAAVLYESVVIESRDPQYHLPFPIVAIYPKEGTFWSDHPVGVVQREWVTAEHKEAADVYTAYLLARPQQEGAIRFGFRPADPAVALASPIDTAHGVNPKEPQTTLEVPEPVLVDAVLDVWDSVKKNARVVLAVDVSGSMNEEGKIVAARDGAAAFIAELGDRDNAALITFNDKVTWALPLSAVGGARPRLTQIVGGLFASGGTALYDAVNDAYGTLSKAPDTSNISAIVVLSDGDDRDSKTALEKLLERIRFDSEGHPIRIFTIGYGSAARADVLQKIADVTQGRYYAGKPENIRDVFKDISTFF
jgi:Ca-activated chloride channel homolog